MDRATVRAIAGMLQSILLDIMIDGKFNTPAVTARSLRQIADQIEAANPPR